MREESFSRSARRRGERITVDEEPPPAIEKLRPGVEPHAAGEAPRRLRLEHDMGLRRREIFADEALDIAMRPADARKHAVRESHHLARNARRRARRPEARIAIARLRQPALMQPVEERRAELGAARRAKADRI